jgi:hypothetical protein
MVTPGRAFGYEEPRYLHVKEELVSCTLHHVEVQFRVVIVLELAVVGRAD